MLLAESGLLCFPQAFKVTRHFKATPSAKPNSVSYLGLRLRIGVTETGSLETNFVKNLNNKIASRE